MAQDQRFRSNANAHGLNFGEIVVLSVGKDGVPVSAEWAEHLADGYLQVVPDVPQPIEGVLSGSLLRAVPDADEVKPEKAKDDKKS